MTRVRLALLLASIAGSGCGREQTTLYPTHIEAPDYDRTAHLAHITGHVVVKATISASGNVIDATASGQPMLANFATKNIRQWTFEKPKHAPIQQTIVYDYELEDSSECETSPTRVTFDLPGRVVIAARTVNICEPPAVVVQKPKK
jgi:TonB family protein